MCDLSLRMRPSKSFSELPLVQSMPTKLIAFRVPLLTQRKPIVSDALLFSILLFWHCFALEILPRNDFGDFLIILNLCVSVPRFASIHFWSQLCHNCPSCLPCKCHLNRHRLLHSLSPTQTPHRPNMNRAIRSNKVNPSQTCHPPPANVSPRPELPSPKMCHSSPECNIERLGLCDQHLIFSPAIRNMKDFLRSRLHIIGLSCDKSGGERNLC